MRKNDYRITVIVDDRERKSEVIQFLLEMKNVSVGIKRLCLGDYLVDNRLVFERKTLNDFALKKLAKNQKSPNMIITNIVADNFCNLHNDTIGVTTR